MFFRHLLRCNSTAAVLMLVTSATYGQTIHVSLNRGAEVEGKAIYFDQSMVALLGRDGELHTFKPSEARNFHQVSANFQSMSQAALRGQLLNEFGRNFDVSGTGQFLVVHPVGQRDLWADRFEQLYRHMQLYFRSRGFRWNSPEFPFIAVVFPTQAQYHSYAKSKGRSGQGTLGYYDPATNRIYLYDVTANQPNSADWARNAETIIHEAVHQAAFNVGIHVRLSDAPKWIVEGLGTLFESPGIWDSRNYRLKSDRINAEQLSNYRRYINEKNSLNLLAMQVSSNDMFNRNPTAAYAHAWALTFYLAETQPRKYASLIERVNRKQPFQPYTKQERIADFTHVFGRNLRMFDAQLQRYIAALE